MRRLAIIAVSLLLTVVCAAPSAKPQKTKAAAPLPTLRLAWERDVLANDAAQTSVAPNEGEGSFVALATTKPERILVGRDNEDAHVIVVRDRATDALLWRRDAPPVAGGEQAEQIDLAFTDRKRVYIRRFRRDKKGLLGGGAFEACEGRTGRILWSVAGEVSAKPDGMADRLYLIGADRKLRLVEAATGRDVGASAPILPDGFTSLVAITDKRVYVGGSVGNFIESALIVDRATGAVGKPIGISEFQRRQPDSWEWTATYIKAYLPKARLFWVNIDQLNAGGRTLHYDEMRDENLRYVRRVGGDPTPGGGAIIGHINLARKGEPDRYQVGAWDAKTGECVLWRRPAPPKPFGEFYDATWQNTKQEVYIIQRGENDWEEAKPRTLYGADIRTGKSRWSLPLPPLSYWTTAGDVLLIWLRDQTGRAVRVRAYLPPPDAPLRK